MQVSDTPTLHGHPSGRLTAPLKIGARGSPLSLAQTGWLVNHLADRLGVPPEERARLLPVNAIVTTGDRIVDVALQQAGGKGLFTKELDEALLDGRIDCAIHSMKDVPTVLPEGIILLPSPVREDPRDVLITRTGASLAELAHGAHLGTASLRRSTQMLHARPDLKISLLRGNVGTRVAKVTDGVFDATLLARAGLVRLGLLDGLAHSLIDPVEMPPAIGQGALAITARAGDTRVAEAWAAVADGLTNLQLAAERAFLKGLDGSCRTAIGGHATIAADGSMRFIGEALSEDGTKRFRRDVTLDNPDETSAAVLAGALAGAIREEAGDHLVIGH
jgi:hydroxymethylbilane synthase